MTITPQKRNAPSAERNKVPIGTHLEKLLPQNAHVLEIASGTGQHGAYFAELRPDIIWQYSDIDADARNSQAAYVQENTAQLKPSIMLDVTKKNWWQKIPNITNIYCANMIHIAPWEAALGLADGAGNLLNTGDNLYLYGPFLLGAQSAKSNFDFSENLKQRNPLWGVRELSDVEKMFAEQELHLVEKVEMPRDNYLLIFAKT